MILNVDDHWSYQANIETGLQLSKDINCEKGKKRSIDKVNWGKQKKDHHHHHHHDLDHQKLSTKWWSRFHQKFLDEKKLNSGRILCKKKRKNLKHLSFSCLPLSYRFWSISLSIKMTSDKSWSAMKWSLMAVTLRFIGNYKCINRNDEAKKANQCLDKVGDKYDDNDG